MVVGRRSEFHRAMLVSYCDVGKQNRFHPNAEKMSLCRENIRVDVHIASVIEMYSAIYIGS